MPTVLAGPILRTVTESSVTVWLALKEFATVTLTIHSSDASIAATIGNPGVADATKIGPNLYIVAVTASVIPSALAHGTLYFYRLSFKTNTDVKDLVQATGAKDISAFAYGTHKLPSFLLPPDKLEDVRFALGSCRKMHAASGDSLALLDDLISANVDSPSGRPQILMLGGDQIYADEVSDTLLMMLTDAGLTLLGSEELPLDENTSTSPDMLPPTTRTKRIKAAGFTSEDTRSHLMGLGEYLAMYLFAWSDVLWIDPSSNQPVIPSTDQLTAILRHPEDVAAIQNDKVQGEIKSRAGWTLIAYGTLKRVRRALANIATYMILDDHEVTDDYNMQRRFCDGVYGSALGRRVVQNGMIAYALCQHWGNRPDQFTGTAPGATLLGLFNKAPHGYPELARNPDLAKIVGVHKATELAARTPYSVYHDADSLVYNYTIEGAAFQLIVTDTRTWRSFTRGDLGPPNLLPDAQIEAQITRTPDLRDRLLMVLVTTNMPNCPSIRQAGRDVPGLPVHKYDFEDFFDSWQIEQIDCAKTIVALAKKAQAGAMANRVIVLSGDVHSSQATRLGYFANQQVGDPAGAPTSSRVVFAQIVASALHNLSDDTIGEHTAGYKYVPGIIKKLFAQPVLMTEGFVGWNPVTVHKGQQVGTRDHQVPNPSVGDVGDPVTIMLNNVPVTFNPDRPTQTTRMEEFTVYLIDMPIKISEPPHYRYRLDYLRRSASGFAISAAPAGGSPLGNQAAASLTYMSWGIAGGAEQVGFSNLGELTFVKSTGQPDWIAQFMVRWGDVGSDKWSRFDVSIDPYDNAYLPVPDPP